MAIDKDVLDQLLAGRDPQELFAKDGLFDELKKSLSERMLPAELDDHLASEGATNRRNGSSRKTMLTGTSKVTLDVPRDRAGTFDPKLIAKYQRRFKLSCPLLSGPSTMTVWTKEGTTNACQEAQARRDHRQAA